MNNRTVTPSAVVTLSAAMSPQMTPDLYRAGSGEPLLLIHGFTDTWRAWTAVLGELVPFFEVIAPTLHGHFGGPPMPEIDVQNPDAMERFTDVFEQRMDELGIDTAHVAGNSLGGGIALQLAKRGRARSVVGLAPAGGMEVGDRAEALRIKRQFKRLQASSRAAAPYVERIMRSSNRRRIALRDIVQMGNQVPAEAAIRMTRASIRCEAVDDVYEVLESGAPWLTGLEQISCPTLVAWGSKDRILPAHKHARRLALEIPGLQYRTLHGLGHIPMWDAPELVGAMIRDHVQRSAKAG